MNAWECGEKKVEVVFQEPWTPRVRTPKRRITYELRYIGKSTDHCIFFIGARRHGDNYTRTALDLRNLVYSAQAPSAACSNSSNTLTSPKHCVFLSLAKQYLGTLQNIRCTLCHICQMHRADHLVFFILCIQIIYSSSLIPRGSNIIAT